MKQDFIRYHYLLNRKLSHFSGKTNISKNPLLGGVDAKQTGWVYTL